MEDLHKQLDALVEQESNRRVAAVLDDLAAYIADVRKLCGAPALPAPQPAQPQEPIRSEVTTEVTGEQSTQGEAQRKRREQEHVDKTKQPYSKVCIICGTPFTSAQWNAKLCSDECRKKQYEAYKASKRAEHTPNAVSPKPRVEITKNCIVCGKAYFPAMPSQKTCSDDCRKEKNRRYARQYINKHKPQPDKASVLVHETPKHPCSWCGRPTVKSVYCSENCRKAKENALRDKLDIPKPETERIPYAQHDATDPLNESMIFDDRWDCQECRELKDLCDLHSRMEAKGKKPHTFKRWPATFMPIK